MWLAQQGWRVTAVDVSETALARAAASDVDGVVDWQRHDLGATFPDGVFDLVSAQFLQSPLDLPIEQVLRRAADAVAPGGTLLVVSHAAPPPWSAHAHHAPDTFPVPSELAAAVGLDAPPWELLVCGVRGRVATGPDGHTGPLEDSIIKARRR
jgi:SAM-dependent methyltransferase